MNIPPRFKEPIRVTYPPNNTQLFEEWFIEQWYARSMQFQCGTDRELLAIPFTSCYVNNNYGCDKEFLQALQAFLDDLPKDKKYFTIVQYDDGILNSVSGLDLLQFSMSKNIGVPIPLLCKPHPFQFKGSKKWFANFIGSATHPIRESAKNLTHSGYYVSFNPHPIEQYCRIIHDSMFTLCYRGYGANSFRIAEAIQYGSIPVYISDEFIEPFGCSFDSIGIKIGSKDVDKIDEILQAISIQDIIKKQDNLAFYYSTFYSYEGAFRYIIKCLESEAAYS